MKRFRTRLGISAVLIIALAMSVMLSGCATLQKEPDYQTLYMAGLARASLLQEAGRYYQMGLMDEETKNKIIAADNVAQQSAKTAIAALKQKIRLEALENAPPDQVEEARKRYEQAVIEFKEKWAELVSLADTYMIKWLLEQE